MSSPQADPLSAADDGTSADGTAAGGTAAGGTARPFAPGTSPSATARSGYVTPPSSANVLADRLAAALVHHEPGWRLPRHSALARRYNVSPADIDAAVEELVGRHLVRRLADGQLYRASPAEYVIGLEGVPGLTTNVDTMGGEFACRSRHLTQRLPPEDIAWALQLPAGQPTCMVRFLWTAGGEPAALCTTYVPGDLASRANVGAGTTLPATLDLLQVTTVADIPAQPLGPADGESPQPASPAAQLVRGAPVALHIELQAPPPSVARSLRLTVGQPALLITIKFAEPETDRPVALTVAALRPDMFRVIVRTPQLPLPAEVAGSSPVSWAHAGEGWES